jgi:hypothetical protein
MSNMSYCRYRNTLEDLIDCYDHLFEDISSVEERVARNRLIITCANIVSNFDDQELDEIVEEIKQLLKEQTWE